jgi:DUF4097 and DUF4098 domain-containing protein YvlB
MPTFDTPAPIAVALELGVGGVHITASDRPDTVVDVRPSDPARPADVAAAEQTRVEYAHGVLRVKAPKGWRHYSFRGGRESVDVRIELPAGSTVRGEAGLVAFRSTGRLGDCQYRTGAGDIQIEEAGALRLRSAAGDITVGRAGGACEVSTASGTVRLGTVDGTLVVKNANGDTEVDAVSRSVRVNTANGRITIGRAGDTVAVKTAYGDVRLGEVGPGTVTAQTAFGKIDIGVRDGVAAWLDLHTALGRVDNGLDAADRPAPGEETVEIKARTAYGDVTVLRRSRIS